MKKFIFVLCMLATLCSCEQNTEKEEDFGYAPKEIAGKTFNTGFYSFKFKSNTSAEVTGQVETNTYKVTCSSIKYERTGPNSALLTFDVTMHQNLHKRVEKSTYSITFTSNNSGLFGGDGEYYFIDAYDGTIGKTYYWQSANENPFSIY